MRGRMGMGTGFNGNGWGWISSLRGWLGMGINCRPRAALYFTPSPHPTLLLTDDDDDDDDADLPLLFLTTLGEVHNQICPDDF